MGPVACLTLLLPLTQAVGVSREILRKEKLTLITCIYNYIHLHCGVFFLLLNDNFLLNKPYLKIQCFTKLCIFRELIL